MQCEKSLPSGCTLSKMFVPVRVRRCRIARPISSSNTATVVMPAVIAPSVSQSLESQCRGEVKTSLVSSKTRYQYFLSKRSSIGAVNGGNGLAGLTPGSVTGVLLGASGAVVSCRGKGSAANGSVTALQENPDNSPINKARPIVLI